MKISEVGAKSYSSWSCGLVRTILQLKLVQKQGALTTWLGEIFIVHQTCSSWSCGFEGTIRQHENTWIKIGVRSCRSWSCGFREPSEKF